MFYYGNYYKNTETYASIDRHHGTDPNRVSG